jgi:hypothetical protein
MNKVNAVDILVSRNALAEDEAKYLSEFNAHLLGHSNLHQRIFYVDRLRKEMAELKQVRPGTCEILPSSMTVVSLIHRTF